jgi:hypothetical protein
MTLSCTGLTGAHQSRVNILVHERVHNVDTLPKLLVVDNPVEPLEPEWFDGCMGYLAERLRFERLYWVIYNQEFRKCIDIVHARFPLRSRNLTITAFTEEELCGRVEGKTKEDGLNISRGATPVRAALLGYLQPGVSEVYRHCARVRGPICIGGLARFPLRSRNLTITAFTEEELCGRVEGKTKESLLLMARVGRVPDHCYGLNLREIG